MELNFQVLFMPSACIMKPMQVRLLQTGAFYENCWLLWNEPDHVFIVDPGDDSEMIISALKKNGLKPSSILLTHGHLDHISALPALVAAYPIPVYMSAADAQWAFTPVNAIPPYQSVLEPPVGLDTDLHEGRIIEAGTLKARVINTPGHSPGCVCFAFDAEKVLVAGDTLFQNSIGRTDLPGSSGAKMAASLTKLMKLDDNFKVLSGHGDATTIGDERRNNPFIAELD